MYEIEHVSGALGAIIHGVDLDGPLERKEIDFLKSWRKNPDKWIN